MAPKSKASGSASSSVGIEQKIADELAMERAAAAEEEEEGEEEEEEVAEEDEALAPNAFDDDMQTKIQNLQDQIKVHEEAAKTLRTERNELQKQFAEHLKTKEKVTLTFEFPNGSTADYTVMNSQTVASVQEWAAVRLGVAKKSKKAIDLSIDGKVLTDADVKGSGSKTIGKLVKDGVLSEKATIVVKKK